MYRQTDTGGSRDTHGTHGTHGRTRAPGSGVSRLPPVSFYRYCTGTVRNCKIVVLVAPSSDLRPPTLRGSASPLVSSHPVRPVSCGREVRLGCVRGLLFVWT